MQDNGREQSQVSAGATCDANENRQQRVWFNAFYDELYYYTLEHFSIIDVDTALVHLAAALPKCRASSSAQFRKWAKQQIEKQANRVRIFEHADRLTVEDVLVLAESQPQRKNTKPFIYEQHGEKAFIKLTDADGTVLPWIIPADWLRTAKVLWPCHVRRNRTGPYVSKKVPRQRHDGTWGQCDLAVHRVFLNCDPGDAVEARNGNMLDWTDENLRVRGPYPDALEHQPVPIDKLQDTLTFNWKPARPKRLINRETGTNDHDRRVLAWLRGSV